MARNTSSQSNQIERMAQGIGNRKTVTEAMSQMRAMMSRKQINTLATPTEMMKQPATGKLADQERSTDSAGLNNRLTKTIPLQIARVATNSLVSNVGSFTRNKAAQNQANNINLFVGKGLNIMSAAKLGPFFLAAAVAFEAIGLASNAYNLSLEIEERQMQASRAATRIGRVVSQRGRD
jgi:hypothetical protein